MVPDPLLGMIMVPDWLLGMTMVPNPLLGMSLSIIPNALLGTSLWFPDPLLHTTMVHGPLLNMISWFPTRCQLHLYESKLLLMQTLISPTTKVHAVYSQAA